MAQSFDAFAYFDHLRSGWRVIAVTCVTAIAVALGISLLLTKKYTATARILISPPGGSDPRTSMSVSPVYLDSLRTYELFASSDDLFQQAVNRFGLRRVAGDQPIDRLKRSILKVSIPRNTRILEISATLPDARKAQELALYVAQETVDLNRSSNLEGDRELTAEAEKRLSEVRERRDQTERAWEEALRMGPVDSLTNRIEGMEELHQKLQQDLLVQETNIAEYEDRQKGLATAGAASRPAEAASQSEELHAARIRADRLRAQIRASREEIQRQERILGRRSAARDRLDDERESAQVAFNAANRQVQEARAAVGYRGERLKIVDRGVVPESPSSPNIPLNTMAAMGIGLIGSLLFLTLQFGYRQRQSDPFREPLHMSHRND
jgi:capsular polysaccharide biosynthesis protein